VPNAALLGAFAGLTQFVRLESVEHAIEQAFPGKVGAANIAAAREAHEFVLMQQREGAA
jgi:pyruvate ferredoxin oxidoreductase gamma subunit